MMRFRDPWPAQPDDDDGRDETDEVVHDDDVEPIDPDEELIDDDARLDDAFPLGDGVADDSAVVYCPYCGEPNEMALDPGSGSQQAYVEDCQVCCQPWQVIVHYLPDGSAAVTVLAADET